MKKLAVFFTAALFALTACGSSGSVAAKPDSNKEEAVTIESAEEAGTVAAEATDEETPEEVEEILGEFSIYEGGDIEINFDDEYVLTYLSGSSITAGGELAGLYPGLPLSQMLEDGYATDADLSEMLGGCKVSDMIPMTINGTPVTVRAVNPYENDAPLSECFLAYAEMDDPTISYGIFDDFRIGTARREEIDEELIASAYSDTGTELLFKTAPSSRMYFDADISKPYGDQVMTDEDHSMDLTFLFGNDGVLTGIKMAESAYLYNGLDDNVSGNVSELDEGQVQSVTATRDDILGELARAFQEAQVDVSIDPRSGSIRLSNEILFGFAESELSDAGKDYLDRFVGVYSSVVLGDAFANQIDAIEIGGHTDPVGTFENNQVLSEKRAQSVYDYCMTSTANGMDDAQRAAFEQKAEVKGYSFSDPVFDEEGNIVDDASRRVEIRFFINVE